MGDATRPVGEGVKLLTHCCNDVGAWGAGFVMAISKRWDGPERNFRSWANPKLGEVQLVQVEDDVIVCNLIGQKGIKKKYGTVPPVRYDAIRKGLASIRSMIVDNDHNKKYSVHMPMMGAGLAGGDWSVVADIVEEELIQHGVEVYVYQLPHLAKSDPLFNQQ